MMRVEEEKDRMCMIVRKKVLRNEFKWTLAVQFVDSMDRCKA